MTTPWDEWQERLSQWWAMAGNLPLRILAALAIGLLLHWILIRVLRQITRRSSWTFDERLLLSAQGTSRWLVVLLALLAVPIDPRDLHPEYIATARHVISLLDRKSTRLNSSHVKISYAVFCLKKKTRTP